MKGPAGLIKGAEKVDLTLGSLDDPTPFTSKHNYATESVLPAWQDRSHLPGIRSEENGPVVNRWIDAVGKLPD